MQWYGFGTRRECQWTARPSWIVKSGDGQITHARGRDSSELIAAVSGGWLKVRSDLRPLLETGSTVLALPYLAGMQR
jgi:hypothetical protein